MLSSDALDSNDLEQLLVQIHNGSQDAAWELVDRYGRHIYRIVRRQMSTEIRSTFDSHDFVQAVWGSFFTDSRMLREIRDPASLLATLAAMARNKVVDEVRRREAAKRQENRTRQPIDETQPQQSVALQSREPTPSQIAMAKERWEHMMNIAGGREKEILQLRFNGLSYAEIAEQLDISERTVIRAMGLLRHQLA